MAMQPIDQQTLFTQMDKVGKNQVLQKEGLQLQASLQHTESQKKAEQQVKSVNQAQDMGYGTSKIKDENSHSPGQEKKSKDNESGDDEKKNEKAAAAQNNYFRDPTLGRNIDISG
ncbi:MAG: hypothetical protein FWD78_03555 [Treponema sp.]|nr:hypothetical protein [Treponema sp.]